MVQWFRETPVDGVDPLLPGLYEWRIEGVGCYIGQYTRSTRPRREYALNVGRILTKRPYRKSKPEGFRVIHVRLADAARCGRSVKLSLIENVLDKADRNRREREMIADRRREAARGGLPVLNGN